MAPIKGMTDRPSDGFPRLGKLRKGAPKETRQKDGREYQVVGRDLDYFRFTAEPGRHDAKEIEEAFCRHYGEKPQRLLVYLPYPARELVFPANCEYWLGDVLMHRCDGHTMSLWLDDQGRYSSVPAPCPFGPAAEPRKERTRKEPGCRPVGRLYVLLPGLIEEGFVGVVTLETSSAHDIPAINGSLRDTEPLAALLDQAGLRGATPLGLRGVPFWLYRTMETVSWFDQKAGKRMRNKKSLVKLVPDGAWLKVMMEQMRALSMGAEALTGPAAAPQLQITEGNKVVDVSTGEVLAGPPEDDDEVTEGDFAFAETDGNFGDEELEQLVRETSEDLGVPSADLKKPGKAFTAASGKPAHWITNPDARTKFWDRVITEGLTRDDVKAAIGTLDLITVDLTADEVLAKVRAYKATPPGQLPLGGR